MIDNITGNPAKVQCDGNAGPYAIVPESKVSSVREVLRKNGVPFNENANSIKSSIGTDVTFDFGKDADIDRIQSILDSVP